MDNLEINFLSWNVDGLREAIRTRGFESFEAKKKAYENKLEELGREFDLRHSSRMMYREELLNDMTRSRILEREEL